MVRELRKKEYDVLDVKEEELYGITDKEVFEKADKDHRIILTHDKDYIHLSEHFLTSNCGVIVIRYTDQSPDNVAKNFVPLLDKYLKEDLYGKLALVSDNFIDISSFENN